MRNSRTVRISGESALADQVDRDEFEAILGTPLGVEPAKIADLYGLPHVVINDLAGLTSAADAGTAIIEVPVDRRRNVEIHRRIADRATEALSALRTAER